MADNKFLKITPSPRARVNGANLHRYHGKAVCVLGTVVKSEGGGGAAFKLKTSDGQEINIRLKESTYETLSGMIEVYGIGQGKNLVLADTFTTFPEQMSSVFDMATYNDCINLINAQPNPWTPQRD